MKSQQPKNDDVTGQDPVLPEDRFLRTFLGSLALDYAIRQGLIARLAKGDPLPDGPMTTTLSTLLQDAGVVKGGGLTDAFLEVWSQRREILEKKLSFLMLAARDVVSHFDDLMGDLPRFMGQSETFALFRYDRALSTDQTALDSTRPWVEYVTALSRAEAPHLAPRLPLEGVENLLEIGGNTGVMARAILDLHPDMHGVILDLPAVCALAENERVNYPRLKFVAGDARRGAWPDVKGYVADAVLFKSVLHDWPESDAKTMIGRAVEYLPSGGRVIVCERGVFGDGPMPFSMTANVVFAPFYREPTWYEAAFDAAGLKDIARSTVLLDMPFHIVSGVLP